MSSLIESTWTNAAVLIENLAGETGTGFLVGRQVGEKAWQNFLVTNKHVISKDPAARRTMAGVRLHLNVEKGGVIAGDIIDYPLANNVGESWLREHPDPEVDVAAIWVTALFQGRPDIVNKCAPEESFAISSKRKELDITAGEDIVVVGYPSGIRQGKTNSPLIRQGIISSRLGEEIHEEVPRPGGGMQVRKSRGFLIDGATIPGSSGSPVILKPVTGRKVRDHIELSSCPALLLGIIAETRFAPIEVLPGQYIPGFAGLGLAFDVETIVEVLDLFPFKKLQKPEPQQEGPDSTPSQAAAH